MHRAGSSTSSAARLDLEAKGCATHHRAFQGLAINEGNCSLIDNAQSTLSLALLMLPTRCMRVSSIQEFVQANR